MTYRLRDLAERTFWTALVAILGAMVGVPLLDIEAWKAAALAAMTAAGTPVVVFARWRLSVLPDPGHAIADEAAGA